MIDGAFADLLAAWLPAQRWFAGDDGSAADVAITSDIALTAAEPELRHLIVAVRVGAEVVSYQLLVGLRTELPPTLAPAMIGPVTDGRIAYDALRDPELTTNLLRGIAANAVVGPLQFTCTPGAAIDASAAGRTLPAEQSNTSIVFGDQVILKVLRRPHQGLHPDLEVPRALAASGSRLVATPVGWIEGAGPGEPTVLAILSEYFTGASDGWSLAMESLRAAEPDFTADASLLGRATAGLHAELAAAFGTASWSSQDLAGLAAAMNAELDRALAEVPALRPHEDRIRACYGQLAGLTGPVRTQRIHGDYHLAQVLRTAGGWVILDFEGEPSTPLAQRRAFSPVLRDVAGMLRSFDYAARHQLLERPDDQRLRSTALAWAASCSEAFCAGYAEAGGPDPRVSGSLLRALTFSKAVYEAVYEARHRPGWLPIPLAAIAEDD
jgi:maltokinase